MSRKHRFVPRLETLESRVLPVVTLGFAAAGASGNYAAGDATTTDSAGDVYVAGFFMSSLTLGGTTLNAQGNSDDFVAKFSSTGAVLWVKDFGAAGATLNQGYTIATDSSGNVYYSGSFTSTVNFGGGYTLSAAGGNNAFVLKLDTNGNTLWADDLGSGGFAIGTALGLDSQGNVYTTGYFDGTNLDFDPGPGTHFLSSPAEDTYHLGNNNPHTS